MILVTGSNGLIGRHLIELLIRAGVPHRKFDIRNSMFEDTRDASALRRSMEGVEGVVHLAAVSRVVWAQRHPNLAEAINVCALRSIGEIANDIRPNPWILFASSREVYGNPEVLPVRETATFNPINTYAHTKVQGELLVQEIANAGILTNVCRFSNVYGCDQDHSDRVAVAFARTAANGGTLRVDGSKNIFDFTHVLDVATGLFRLIEATRAGENFPPLHFVSGTGTTLGELASLAVEASHSSFPVSVLESLPRDFDVAQFVGDPSHTESILGWKAKTPIEEGFSGLVEKFRKRPMSEGESSWLEALLSR